MFPFLLLKTYGEPRVNVLNDLFLSQSKATQVCMVTYFFKVKEAVTHSGEFLASPNRGDVTLPDRVTIYHIIRLKGQSSY